MHALARSNSAAARIVRNATPLCGVLAYFVPIACSVRRAYTLEAGRTSLMERPVISSRVPSRDPPSALMMTARSRGKPRRMASRIVWTIEPMLFALL